MTLQLEYEDSTFYGWTAASDEQAYTAPTSLVGETGIQPPGGAIIDGAGVGSTCRIDFALEVSPSAGVDTILWSITVDSGGGPATTTGTQALPASSINTGIFNTNPTGHLRAATIQAKNSVTGDVSVVADLFAGGLGFLAFASQNDMTEATSTRYYLQPPAAPTINSVFSGSASLAIPTVPGVKVTHVELWENTVNDSSTATLISTSTNVGNTYARTAAAGTVKFYWARAKNNADTKFSLYSRPTLVVF